MLVSRLGRVTRRLPPFHGGRCVLASSRSRPKTDRFYATQHTIVLAAQSTEDRALDILAECAALKIQILLYCDRADLRAAKQSYEIGFIIPGGVIFLDLLGSDYFELSAEAPEVKSRIALPTGGNFMPGYGW